MLMSWVCGCHYLQWRADVVWLWGSPGVCPMSRQTSHQLLSSACDICCFPSSNHKVTPWFGVRKPRATELLQLFGYVISRSTCSVWWLIMPRKHNTAFNEPGQRPPYLSKWLTFESLLSFPYDQKELKNITKALWHHKRELCGGCEQGYSGCFEFWVWFVWVFFKLVLLQASSNSRVQVKNTRNSIRYKIFVLLIFIFYQVDIFQSIDSYTYLHVQMKYMCICTTIVPV